MSEEITIRFRWTLEELSRATKWHWEQASTGKVRPMLFAAIGILLTAAGAMLCFRDGLTHQTIWAFAPGLFFWLMFVLLRVVMPWAVRRNFAKNPSLDMEIEWQITDENVRITDAHGWRNSDGPPSSKRCKHQRVFCFILNLPCFTGCLDTLLPARRTITPWRQWCSVMYPPFGKLLEPFVNCG